MKQKIFLFLFATLLMACSDNSVIDEDVPTMQEESFLIESKTFSLGKGNAKIMYQSKIGYNFDSALDSLIRKYEPVLNKLAAEGHYSGTGITINKETINVNFNYDSRTFLLLTFIDKLNIFSILFTGDVIDERGNYYRLIECED